MRTPRPAVLGCLLGAILLGPVGCGSTPEIKADLRHPDADKQITFTTGPGSITETITQSEILVAGATVHSGPGPTISYVGGPYVSFSNMNLLYCARATLGSGSQKLGCGSAYVANPKGHWTYTAPNGSNNGYPNATTEQTGANLYRLDRLVVHNRAQDALAEYVNWYNGQTPSTSDDITIFEAANVADHTVAAVAYYVDRHMSWRDDGQNAAVFAANGFANYSPGWDFPQPADLTLTISGDLTNGVPNDDYQGDCEDHAILRAALLRALGFAPWAIWDVIDNPVSHEYNVVLYEGAFRLMDYGTIDTWLATHTWDSHRSYYGWNEEHPYRYVAGTNHDYLVDFVDNYPGGVDDGNPWSFNVYYKDTSP